MQKLRLRAPSPALVIALIALFVALGGTSYAAITLPKNSVGSKQLKKNAVTGLKIKNGAVTASKINTHGLTVPNATNATSATNATNATNAEPVAFAHVSSTGVVDSANSKGVTGATIYGTSLYCLTGITTTVRGGQATVDYNNAAEEFAQFGLGDDSGHCPAGTKAFVWTVQGTTATAAGFFVVLYG